MQCQFQLLALPLMIFVAHSVRAQTFAAGQGWNFGDSKFTSHSFRKDKKCEIFQSCYISGFGALADDPIAKNVLYTDEEDPWRRCPQPYTLIGMQCLFFRQVNSIED